MSTAQIPRTRIMQNKQVQNNANQVESEVVVGLKSRSDIDRYLLVASLKSNTDLQESGSEGRRFWSSSSGGTSRSVLCVLVGHQF